MSNNRIAPTQANRPNRDAGPTMARLRLILDEDGDWAFEESTAASEGYLATDADGDIAAETGSSASALRIAKSGADHIAY